MAERTLEVHSDWQEETVLVGRLWTRSKGIRETCSFEYADSWRGHPMHSR
jgi:serine/threonine-protein kinase HipA